MKYLLLFSLCVITRFALSEDDFEIIDEQDDKFAGQVGDARGRKQQLSEFDIAYADWIGEDGEFIWSDVMLEKSGIHKITNDIYDDEIYERLDGNKAHWIIIFTKDRFNLRPEMGWNELNQRLFQAMWELKNEKKD